MCEPPQCIVQTVNSVKVVFPVLPTAQSPVITGFRVAWSDTADVGGSDSTTLTTLVEESVIVDKLRDCKFLMCDL